MPREPLDAELNGLFNHGVRMRPAWQQKKKKNQKKKIFSAFISTTRLQYPPTLPVFWLNQASQGNAKGTIGCRIECSIQPWGQNEGNMTTKKTKKKKNFLSIYQFYSVTLPTNIAGFLVEQSVSQNSQERHWMQNWMLYSNMGSEWGQLDNKKKKKQEKQDFFSIYQHHPVTVPTNIACFLVEQSVSQKCQGHQWMQNWMLYSTLRSEWGQLVNKKKKKWTTRFFRYIAAVVTWKFHEHCLFCGWTKRLTKMPRVPLDAELNALFNPAVGMRTAWQEKKKKMKKKIFSALYHYHPSLDSSHEHCLFSGWTKASHRNAKGTIGCRIECSIQPCGRNEDSLARKKKKNEKKDFFSIYHYHPVTVPTNIACFLVEPKVSQKCQGHHWMQNWMLYSTLWSEWGQLGKKKKKKWKKRFFQHLSLPPGYSVPRTLPVFWLNQASHGNAKGTIGCRIECSIQPCGRNEDSLARKKKKNEKNYFSLYHSSSHLIIPRTFPVLWLNKASHRNAKGTNGCRIECSSQPCGPARKKTFFQHLSATVFPRTLPVFWLNQRSHRNAKGTIGCRIEWSIQPWG